MGEAYAQSESPVIKDLRARSAQTRRTADMDPAAYQPDWAPRRGGGADNRGFAPRRIGVDQCIEQQLNVTAAAQQWGAGSGGEVRSWLGRADN
jgi:hypothetical protein